MLAIMLSMTSYKVTIHTQTTRRPALNQLSTLRPSYHTATIKIGTRHGSAKVLLASSITSLLTSRPTTNVGSY
jgi:hypothetical protein